MYGPAAVTQDPSPAPCRQARVSSETSAEEACREALERLEAENPRIGAVVAWDGERALAEARERDGLPHVWRGPLHGIPFTAKDLNDATPYATTYGSRAFADNMPVTDAACIARLRRAGAVLIGKTNTPEMGMRPTTENLLFGATRNPHDTTRTPGGSSGGAAAALVAGIGPLAQGSDGGGSIRIPAACCGVVGHKPTRGLVSGAPATYDAWEGFATNGPMARTVADCALMLEVMAGPEPGDAYYPPPHDGAFVAACAEDPAPLRIGVCASRRWGLSTSRSLRSSMRRWRRSRGWGTGSRRPSAARRAHGAVRDDRARPERRLPADRRARALGAARGPRRAQVVADGERVHRRRLRAGGRGRSAAGHRRACSTRWRPSSSSSPPC